MKKKPTKTDIAKFAANLLVGSGTTTVTNSIIRNNVPANGNLFQQVSVGVASFVIGSMAAQATKDHTSARIDELVAAWQSAKESSTEEPQPTA